MKRAWQIGIGAALFVAAGATWRGQREPSPEVVSVASVAQAQTRPRDARRVRSILALEARDGAWLAVWCYLPRAQVRTVFGWKRNQSVTERVNAISRGRGEGGNEWAVINGGYFDWNRHDKATRAIIGSVGNGKSGKWSHGSPPSSGGRRFQRWAWGVSQSGSETRFRSAVMERRAGRVGFWVSPRVEKSPYGLSGLLCLVRNGQAQAWRDASGETHAMPRGQWNGRTEFLGGAHRWAAAAWSADGNHLFLLVHRAPTTIVGVRDLFARYEKRRYLGPGPILNALRAEFGRLPPSARPCDASQLPRRIANAFVLDSGKCATLKYRRLEDGRARDWGSWETGAPWKMRTVRVPTTLEVSER